MQINQTSWHGQLFVSSYTAFNQKPPKQIDLWSYSATVAAAAVFLICSFFACLLLNISTIPFGVFAEPAWRDSARFRLLAFPGGIPIISIAMPAWFAIAAWHNAKAHGIGHTLAPFVITMVLAFALVGCAVLFNKTRGNLRRRFLPQDAPGIPSTRSEQPVNSGLE